jgi:T4 bacteriophage base plate protein
MPALAAMDLVDIWEQGCASGRAERAYLLLSRAHPEMSGEELEALPLGSHDAMLLQLREQMFGPWLESVVKCPQCGEWLEINVDIRELRHKATSASVETALLSDNLRIRFRVPTGGDLRDLENCNDKQEARQQLIRRCVLEAHRGEKKIEPSLLTREETVALADRVAEVDPHGELILNGDCPKCAHRWPTPLDIASFLWQELELAVNRLLGEVHTLAWAYCWSERDILAMSARRRRVYLELLAG